MNEKSAIIPLLELFTNCSRWDAAPYNKIWRMLDWAAANLRCDGVTYPEDLSVGSQINSMHKVDDKREDSLWKTILLLLTNDSAVAYLRLQQ